MSTTQNMFVMNFEEISNESWFIPIDILTMICIIFALILVIIFFFMIVFNKTCRTVPMLLVGNSCLASIQFGILILSMNLFRFMNDLKQMKYEDSTCRIRGYVGFASCSILNCSFLLQAVYRFMMIVYPNRLYYQSAKFQFYSICFTWIFGYVYPVGFLFTREILYNASNQICQLPLKLSFSIIYMANFAYITPVTLTMLVYLKLVLYVKEMSNRVLPINRLVRVRNELKMVRRTVIMVSILIIYCLPYAIFIFTSFFTPIPKYHFRISYVFIDASFLFVVIAIFQFTDPLKTSIINAINGRANLVLPTLA